MATLEIRTRTATAEDYPPATVVELIGSIDPTTLNVLEDAMDRCTDEGHYRVIFDMAELNYINSTGMGMFVQFADALREKDGNLVLMRVAPKVLLVVEMLGLQELFRIVPDEATALPALSGAGIGTVAVVDLTDEEAAPAAAGVGPAPAAAGDMPAPVTLPCPACQAKLVAPPFGNYRCPRCRTVLVFDGKGVVRSYPEDTTHAVEMSLPADPAYIRAARAMFTTQGEVAKLPADATEKFVRTVDVVLTKLATMLRRRASGDMRLHCFTRATEGKVALRIYCAGDALDRDAFSADQDGVARLRYTTSKLGNLDTIEQH